VAVVAVFGIVIATLSVNIAANLVSPANDFANVAPKYISFKTGGLITCVLGVACLPWKLMADPNTYINGWLTGVSALLGPIAGIMIADYWLVRKCTLDVRDLYLPNGTCAGFNPVALVALTVGVLPNLPGFLWSIGALDTLYPVWGELYVYAWFTGTLIAGVVYTVGMRFAPHRAVAAA
jgi:NCS1 family nucleobase:cation symporter-1